MAKFCAKCGAPVPEGSRFCSACGTPVAQNTPPAPGAPAAQAPVPQAPAPQPPAVKSPAAQPPAVYPQAAQPPVPRPPAAQTPAIQNSGAKKQGGGKKPAIIIGVVCGVIVLLIAAFLALFFMDMLPFELPGTGRSSVSSEASEDGDSMASDLPASASMKAGEDPSFIYLRGLDMTFNQLNADGHEDGDSFNGRPTYIFTRLGDEAGFAFAEEDPAGDSQPVCLVTTVEKLFPELSGLSAEEAGSMYSPYLSVDTAADGGGITYETENYTFTIDADPSGSLRGRDPVSVTKKGVPVPTEAPSSEPSPSPTPEPTPSPAPSPTPMPTPEIVESSYYILPQSNQRLLTYVDIQNFTKQDIMLARNEIFARHGRKFQDEDVRTYFESQSWYKGTIEPGDFSTSVFSDIETKNVDFLKQYEDGLNGISQNVGNSGSVVTYSGYIIPQSSSRRLTYADIAGLSSWQLSMARNEIYARHGRMFNDPDIRSYFQSQSWYSGRIAPEDFDASVLSDTEVYNIDFILSYE